MHLLGLGFMLMICNICKQASNQVQNPLKLLMDFKLERMGALINAISNSETNEQVFSFISQHFCMDFGAIVNIHEMSAIADPVFFLSRVCTNSVSFSGYTEIVAERVLTQ